MKKKSIIAAEKDQLFDMRMAKCVGLYIDLCKIYLDGYKDGECTLNEAIDGLRCAMGATMFIASGASGADLLKIGIDNILKEYNGNDNNNYEA